MFSRFYLVCLYVGITCNMHDSLALKQNTDLPASSQLKNYDLKIIQHDVKFAELEKYISGLETKIEHQNVRFAKQDAPVEHQKVRFAELEALIEHQNTEMANLKTLISDQNTKICGLTSQLETLQKSQPNVTETQPLTIGNDTGVMFTRWGRTDCPKFISTQVYNGTTGGAHYTHSGGSVNYVCMPHDPIFNENKFHRGSTNFQYLYGAEYDIKTQPGLFQFEVPCVVCRAAPYTTKMMIPGRDKCYPGWQNAYFGQLMSGYYGHAAASEYVCLDQHPTTIGSKSNHNGKLFYHVKTRCGSLPCPPYEHDALLTCAVCLK